VSGPAQVIYDEDREPVPVATADELDALPDQVQATAPTEAPPLVALDMPDQQRSLLVGLRGPVGVLNFMDLTSDGGSISKAPRTSTAAIGPRCPPTQKSPPIKYGPPPANTLLPDNGRQT
jgi:hypothetical protein